MPGIEGLNSLGKTRLVEEFIAENDEIMRHKWFESERAGRDVGYEYARVDWTLRHRGSWARLRAKERRNGTAESGESVRDD